MDYQYLDTLAHWINTRYAVFRAKELQGLPAPWSTDSIINTYRFCNVHRENDRVTRWIRENWRDKLDGHPELWQRMLMARMINWPPTLQYLGLIRQWDADYVHTMLNRWNEAGNKVFTSAYIVSTNGIKIDKIQYVVAVWDNCYEIAQNEQIVVPDSLAQTHKNLMTLPSVGSFMAAQVVADLKHTSALAGAADWWEWAAPGPGSMRGLNRLKGYDLKRKWNQDDFVAEMENLLMELEPRIEWVPDICAQNLQNCLCEFDKYMRVLKGEGKPRSKYTPHTYPVSAVETPGLPARGTR